MDNSNRAFEHFNRGIEYNSQRRYDKALMKYTYAIQSDYKARMRRSSM